MNPKDESNDIDILEEEDLKVQAVFKPNLLQPLIQNKEDMRRRQSFILANWHNEKLDSSSNRSSINRYRGKSCEPKRLNLKVILQPKTKNSRYRELATQSN